MFLFFIIILSASSVLFVWTLYLYLFKVRFTFAQSIFSEKSLKRMICNMIYLGLLMTLVVPRLIFLYPIKEAAVKQIHDLVYIISKKEWENGRNVLVGSWHETLMRKDYSGVLLQVIVLCNYSWICVDFDIYSVNVQVLMGNSLVAVAFVVWNVALFIYYDVLTVHSYFRVFMVILLKSKPFSLWLWGVLCHCLNMTLKERSLWNE